MLLKDLVFFSLTGFHLFKYCVEAKEIGFPEFSVVFQPLIGFGERLGRKAARAALAIAAAGDEAGAFEDPEVFGDGGKRHLEGLGEFGDFCFTLRQASEDGAPSGVGESAKGGVKGGNGMINHMV